MARTIGRLTALTVAKAKTKGRYADGGDLYLQVSSSGAKSWIYRFMLNGRLREMGLGPVNAFSLAEARAKAAECRKLTWEGTDPIDARSAVRASATLEAAHVVTFREAATAYCAAHKAAWKNEKHADQWTSTLSRFAYPVFGDLPVQSVDVRLVMTAIEPLWASRTETASRLRGRIEAILDWAKARGYRDGENPARWRGHLENLLPKRSKVRKVQHHPALPYRDIGAFMAVLRRQQSLAARALELLILTATRTNEALGARWSEIDLDAAAWLVPGERTKMGRDHRIALSPPAVAILRELHKVSEGEHVFPGGKRGKPLSNMSMLMLLKRMKRDDITVHGFRSSFRDWTAEQTNHGREVAEMALAHAVENKVEAAYRRGALFLKRKPLMEDWARYCAAEQSPGEVVQLKAGGSQAA